VAGPYSPIAGLPFAAGSRRLRGWKSIFSPLFHGVEPFFETEIAARYFSVHAALRADDHTDPGRGGISSTPT
jgi:hypothetical protein